MNVFLFFYKIFPTFTAVSVQPLLWGYLGELVINLKSYFLAKVKNSELNCLQLSLLTVSGIPYLENSSLQCSMISRSGRDFSGVISKNLE